MYMLTGLLWASKRAVFHTLSAGTQVIFSDFSGANGAAISPSRSKTGLQEISSSLPVSNLVPKRAGWTPSL